MWKQLLLVQLLMAVSWQMRIRRQENPDDCEWWDKICQENAGANSTPSATTATTSTTTETPVKLRCTCVPYFQCKEGDVNKDGDELVDVRQLNASDDSPAGCVNPLEICCNHPKRDRYVPACGLRRTPGANDRFLQSSNNMSRAFFGEFPWMALVLNSPEADSDLDDAYICGGSLIHPQVVLTSAHCVANEKTDKLAVRLGEWDTSTLSEWLPHQELAVADVVIHHEYRASSAINDYGLLFLAQPAFLAPYVDTVCLPSSLESVNSSSCVVTGWGLDRFDQDDVIQPLLKKVHLPIVAHDVCQSALRTTRLGPYFKLHASFLCAGGTKGSDTCLGDGGSPLVCPLNEQPDRYVQVGIVSWGIGCGDEVPAAYSNVVQAARWIRDTIGQRVNLHADYFQELL